MRRIWLVGCLALAACDDAVILEVHTHPNAPAQEVTLFIGLGSCGDCPGIKPPNIPELLPGSVLFRDDSFRETRALTAKVEGGVATFRIESGVSKEFSIAVAVDNNQRSAALIQTLPLDDAGRYRVELREANVGGGLGVKPTTTSGNFVGIWAQPGGSGTCMGFENWSDGRLVDRFFIVPADDFDCDARGDQNMECAPFGFDGTGLPTFEEATCTVPTPAPMDAGQICWLGGPACDEPSGMKFDCLPTDYCVPDSFCETANTACAATAGPINVNACLFMTPPSAKLKCTVSFEAQDDNVHAHLCKSDFTFDLLPQRAANSPLACVQPPDNRHMYERPRVGEPSEFSDKIALTTKDSAGMMYPFELGIHYNFDDCTYKVQLNGEKAVGAVAPIEKVFFAQFWTLQGGARLHKMLVPVELTYVNDCTRESSCVLVPDASLMNCLR